MGTDTVTSRYHLTPEGWINGGWAANRPLENLSPPPKDCIETWEEKEQTHDDYPGKPIRDWKLVWASSDFSEDQRKQYRIRAKERATPTEKLSWKFPL
ncbi:MAG: hypothetical protein NPIRA03_25780 [Nitrospirales bacterium]|nr:MAG: hypothetical protein NPIRA03_25780 [Nitrospirales bacterium]